MHIAHFTNTYKPNVNGVVRSVSTFRTGLTSLGHLVFIFAQETPPDYEEPEAFIFRYPGVNIPIFDYSLTMPASPFVNKLLPSLKLDVIHSNHPILLGNAAADQAEKLGVPLVFTFHTSYLDYVDTYTDYVPSSKAFIGGMVAEGLVQYLSRCQHIITPSDSIKQALETFGGLTDRVTTIPTGIDLAPYQTADGQAIRQKYNLTSHKVLISIGRLAEEKNWITLLAAVAQVAAIHSEVRLIILGDGPQREVLETYTQEVGLTDRVIFTGLVPFEEIPAYLKAADIFCFASTTETQGLVTMEALAAGLPVIAVDATGTRDAVVSGQEGLLTDNDPAALAQAIQQILADDALLTHLQTNALKKAGNFEMTIQAKKMVAVYEQAIDDKKANRYVQIDRDRVEAAMHERQENA